MSLTKLSSWSGIIKLFLVRESLVSVIPAGDVKIANLFLQCTYRPREPVIPFKGHWINGSFKAPKTFSENIKKLYGSVSPMACL
jgi:hypothetical protein